MLKTLKETWLASNYLGKLIVIYFLTMIIMNGYGTVTSIISNSYKDSAVYFIHTITLLAVLIGLVISTRYLEQAKKLFKEANKLYSKGYEDKRMEMYEKLLEKKEKEIQ